jgi:HK97 gp10 family phage protein
MSGIQIAGMDGLLNRLRKMPVAITTAVAAEMQDGANAIASEAKQRAPGDQGFLRNQIGVIKQDATTFQVFSGADYSPFVEFGTLEKVQIPPGLEEYASQFKGDFASGTYSEGGMLSFKEAIFLWCERKGIDPKLWYAIYVSIGIHGTTAQPFFFPAVERLTPIIIDRVNKAVEANI